MNTQTLDKIKTLRDAHKRLSSLPERYAEAIKDTSCDKHAFLFGGDDRFAVFTCSVFLDAHLGYYGNSSCYSMDRIDNKLAQTLLNRVLNRRKNQILNEMAEEALKEARGLESKAREEIAKLTAMLDETSGAEGGAE